MDREADGGLTAAGSGGGGAGGGVSATVVTAPPQGPKSELDHHLLHHGMDERVIELSLNGRYSKLNYVLGKGAYKVVYKAIDRSEGLEVAWNSFQTSRAEFNDLSQEIEILKRVRHPNIINFHDCWYNGQEFVFVTELMTSGTLREFIKRLDIPNLKIVKNWCKQILAGIEYLHSREPPIIHRDIKCDNIFVNGSQGMIKIGDMGTAKMKQGKKYTVIGTPEFMAPEMYEEKGYTDKVDIYAFGMCLLEMVTGDYPYAECKNAAQIYRKVSNGLKPECLDRVDDPEVLDVVNHCLAPEDKRLSASELLRTPFMTREQRVIVLLVAETAQTIKLRVVHGNDKVSVKFEFNIEEDTPENVASEMVQEHVIPAEYQSAVQFELSRIHYQSLRGRGLTKHRGYTLKELSTRDFSQRLFDGDDALAPPVPPKGMEPKTPVVTEGAKALPPLPSAGSQGSYSNPSLLAHSNSQQPLPPQPSQQQSLHSQAQKPLLHTVSNPFVQTPPSSQPISAPNHSLSQTTHSQTTPPTPAAMPHPTPSERSLHSTTSGSNLVDQTTSLAIKEYSADSPVDELVYDAAQDAGKTREKAQEWIQRLHEQDVITVRDLRALYADDWTNLKLTVLAARTLKNYMSGSAKRTISSTAAGVGGATGSGVGPAGVNGSSAASGQQQVPRQAAPGSPMLQRMTLVSMAGAASSPGLGTNGMSPGSPPSGPADLSIAPGPGRVMDMQSPPPDAEVSPISNPPLSAATSAGTAPGDTSPVSVQAPVGTPLGPGFPSPSTVPGAEGASEGGGGGGGGPW